MLQRAALLLKPRKFHAATSTPRLTRFKLFSTTPTPMSKPSTSSSSSIPSSGTMSTPLPTPPPPLYETLRPPRLPDMRSLDRDAFTLRQRLLAVRVDVAKLSSVRTDPRLRGWMMDLSKARLVLDDKEGDGSTKLLRLKVSREEDLPEGVRELLQAETRGYVQDELVVDYDMWTASDVLNSILPAGEAGDMAPSAFTTTGHIGHVNLKDTWIPYKDLIGQVFLDKNPNLRTIVNKLDSIHAEFRYFDMEVLAGEPDFVTSLSESGCTFTFDFSKVYWNSRLQHEHDRLIDLLPVGSVVADVMAGVGPFAVPAAKKGCYVLGNDLNPESVRWMRENQAKNKVEKTLRVTELDGKAFIQQSARMAWDEPFEVFVPPAVLRKQAAEARRQRDIAAKLAGTHVSAPTAESDPVPADTTASTSTSPSPPPRLLPQHYIMNLPDSALTFLGAFNGLYDSLAGDEAFEAKLAEVGLPLVHVYCFTRELELETATTDICQRASQYLGHAITPSTDAYHLHLVRRVAPNKDMYCLTFRLPRAVAFTSSPTTAAA